jgi:ankyrin repeat protein
LHGEWEAIKALIEHGARVNVPVAAALGDVDQFRRLLTGTDSRDRHMALGLASQFGHIEMVRLLLDAGEDPNRYNKSGDTPTRHPCIRRQ